jgi:hypothetical protein
VVPARYRLLPLLQVSAALPAWRSWEKLRTASVLDPSPGFFAALRLRMTPVKDDAGKGRSLAADNCGLTTAD